MIDKITLYPSNWLYNAGVIGLAYQYPEFVEFKNGILELDKKLFTSLNIERDYFDKSKIINLVGKNEFYPNFIDSKGNQKQFFISFINSFLHLSETGYCSICSNPYYLPDTIIEKLLKKNPEGDKFLTKINSFDMVYNRLLGPTKKFPNGLWNVNQSLKICHLCSFILIHHHLSYTKLSDGSNIFINSPSFKIMYELNRLAKAMVNSDQEGLNQKNILAISLIEYSRKIAVSLGNWTLMNIEIVVKRDDKIDFFSLPLEVMQIISNREIANMISAIGETKILTFILNQNYEKLISLANQILRISLKSEEQNEKVDKGILKDNIRLSRNNSNLVEFAYKLLKLYSLIEEKLKGENQ